MKKLAFILALLATGGCVSHLTSIAKRNQENISNACQIVETKKKQLAHQDKQAGRRTQSKNVMTYSKYKRPIISKITSNVTATDSKHLLASSAASMPIEVNQESSPFSKNKTDINKNSDAPTEAIGSNAKSARYAKAIERSSKFRFSAQAILAIALTTLFAAGLFNPDYAIEISNA
jgi:hypothetical protein